MHTHTHTHACTHAHTHTRTQARMHARTHAHTHTHMHTHTHSINKLMKKQNKVWTTSTTATLHREYKVGKLHQRYTIPSSHRSRLTLSSSLAPNTSNRLQRCTSGGVYVPCYWHAGWACLLACQVRMEFMYLVLTCMPGGCIYLHARWEWSLCTLYLPACQVSVFTCMSGENVVYVPCTYLHIACQVSVFTYMPGENGVYIPCTYLHARWESYLACK